MDKHGKRLALNRLIIRHKYWWFAAACCFLLCYSAGENLFNWACIANGTNPDFRKDWGDPPFFSKEERIACLNQSASFTVEVVTDPCEEQSLLQKAFGLRGLVLPP